MNTMPIAYNLVFEHLEELLYEDFMNLDTETQSEIDFTDFEKYVFGEKIPNYLRNIDFTNFMPPNGFRTGEKIQFLEDFIIDMFSPAIRENFKNSVEENELDNDLGEFENYLNYGNFIIAEVNNAYCGEDFGSKGGRLDIDYILKFDIKEKIEGYKRENRTNTVTKEKIESTAPVEKEQFPREWTTK